MSLSMHSSGTEDRFIWTTQAHLLSLFLDCPRGMGMSCPNAQDKADVRAAIHRGDITWHAMPFNLQFEMADPGLLGFAVDMVHEMDERFNKTLKRTISLVSGGFGSECQDVKKRRISLPVHVHGSIVSAMLIVLISALAHPLSDFATNISSLHQDCILCSPVARAERRARHDTRCHTHSGGPWH